MTETEIALVVLGIEIGMLIMLLVQVTFGILDDRRERKAARAAQARLDAARSRADA